MGEENLKASLEKIDFQSFAKINKSLLITILIKQKMYVGAYDLICEYGYEEISFVDLLHLCTCMIQIFSLQVNFGAAQVFGHTLCVIKT